MFTGRSHDHQRAKNRSSIYNLYLIIFILFMSQKFMHTSTVHEVIDRFYIFVTDFEFSNLSHVVLFASCHEYGNIANINATH